jgi:hypothetical protein
MTLIYLTAEAAEIAEKQVFEFRLVLNINIALMLHEYQTFVK